MPELSAAHDEHIKELLQDCEFARDQLPYSEDFVQLKRAFWLRSFRKLSDHEFWLAIVRVAKKGGISGKPRGDIAPELTEEQRDTLIKMLPVTPGQRDQLPYSERFSRLVARYNTITGLDLSSREIWLAVLRELK